MFGRWSLVLIVWIYPALIFAQNQPEPNTGSDSFGFGAKAFYSQLVFLNLFDGREHENLLDISNGQCDTGIDEFINELYDSEDAADDAEWCIGGITVANLNNTDNDVIQGWFGTAMPRIDGSIYEMDGVMKNQGPDGRNELDLVALKFHKPANWQPNDRLTLAVSGVTGAGVRFYEDDFKEHDARFLSYSYHHLGVDYYVFDPFFVSQQMPGLTHIFFADVNVQTAMNGVSLALFYDHDWDPFMGTYRVHQYDRCTLTGIWATGNVRTTQSQASFERFGVDRSQIIVSGANFEFQQGAQILIYDNATSYSRPQLRVISRVDVLSSNVLRLHLDIPIPEIADPLMGTPVRIGPSYLALDENYRRIWGDGGDVVLGDYDLDWIGILGASDNREMKNGIEVGFQIKPEQATKISLRPIGYGKRLLRFDVTRQAEGGLWVDGVLHPADSKTFPVGDETPNDDDSNTLDEDVTPADGKVYSIDLPGKKHFAAPKFGNPHLPPSLDNSLAGQVWTQELEAKEFLRCDSPALVDTERGGLKC